MRGRLFAAVAAIVVSCLPGSASAGTGFFVGFTEDTPKEIGSAAVEPARTLGAAAFRITLMWNPGQTQLAAADAEKLTRAVGAMGSLRLALAVYADQASEAPTDATAREQYCTYVRNVLAAYPSIRDVVVWNEPNKAFFWKPQFNTDGTSAAAPAYAALLARCYDLLHGARPDVNVIGLVLAPRGNDDPNAASNVSHSPGNFIRQLGEAYRAGARTAPLFDTVGHHVHGIDAAERPWRQHIQSKTLSQGDWNKLMWNLHTAFSGTAQRIPGQCGPTGCVSIWYLEAGYQTQIDPAKAPLYTGTELDPRPVAPFAGGEPDTPSPPAESPAPDQATQIVDGVRLAACQPYVESFFNFLLFDEPSLNGWQSGPFWADRTPKPSYDAFARVIAEANGRSVACAALKGGEPSGDYFPPAAPTGTTAAALTGPLRVAVSWQPAADDVAVTTYRVFRNGAHVGTTTETAWTNVTVASGATYTYTVRALDAAGNLSDASPGATVTTPDTVAPTVPAGLAAQPLASPTRVALTWTASTDAGGVAGYRVYRDGVPVATTAAPAYSDSAVAPAATHAYAVSAYDGAGNESAPSAAVGVRTAPPAPSGLVATASRDGSGRVALDWSDTPDSELAGYTVYRATAAGGPYAKLTTALAASAFDDTIALGTTAYYVVTATNTGGTESGLSGESSAKPRAPIAKGYAPTRATIVAGSVYLGRNAVSRLGSNDSVRYELSGTRTEFYASATLSEPPASLLSLRFDYDGGVSRSSVPVTLSVYDWRTGSWQAVHGPRAPSTTSDVAFGWKTTTPAAYVSATGEVRFRVSATSSSSFVLRTDQIRFTAES